ncbi:uncharacterized protein LOC119684420 [Teleopsis dalmanni]|uniref:uncharacterized protein LOC119684412 n=1 Tax=Teleopsis dalmanni TaxID=139649 RepID=UPI0018CDC08F|nr:uncharacterized protein LOC119684412 [Teleopsis dalmanni]XP_037954389.1 uncharacterized protein LOC119684420 [Teleopsis dalmanni]
MAPITKFQILKLLRDVGTPASLKRLVQLALRRNWSPLEMYLALRQGVYKKYIKYNNGYYYSVEDMARHSRPIRMEMSKGLDVPFMSVTNSESEFCTCNEVQSSMKRTSTYEHKADSDEVGSNSSGADCNEELKLLRKRKRSASKDEKLVKHQRQL